jgi:hypothetical protein
VRGCVRNAADDSRHRDHECDRPESVKENPHEKYQREHTLSPPHHRHEMASFGRREARAQPSSGAVTHLPRILGARDLPIRSCHLRWVNPFAIKKPRPRSYTRVRVLAMMLNDKQSSKVSVVLLMNDEDWAVRMFEHVVRH